MNIIVNSITSSDLEKLEKSINHEVVYVKEMTQFFNDEIVKGEEGGVVNTLNNLVGYTALNVLGKDNIPINLVYVKDLTKARGGVYKNTAQNKKLGRIGAKYGEPTGGLANEIRSENKKADPSKVEVKDIGFIKQGNNTVAYDKTRPKEGPNLPVIAYISNSGAISYHKHMNKEYSNDVKALIDKKAEGIKGGKKPQSDAQKKFTGDVASGKTNLSEMAGKKEDITTDSELVLIISEIVNDLKESRNKAKKGSSEYKMLVSKIEAAEKRRVTDDTGKTTGWKKK